MILKVIAANGLVEAWLRVDFGAEGTEFTESGARKVDRRELGSLRVDGGAENPSRLASILPSRLRVNWASRVNMEKGSISLAKR